ncbi:actin-related protein 8-like [Branchiostoma floridae]|uniref:Actin-related protein 8 n=1 Tax=Branchiostoma floridae TaxID=7739 RepID=A0A9J7KHW7_BRAFL|nr:actin-related protein 8-like [Branchiostoma floridae]
MVPTPPKQKEKKLSPSPGGPEPAAEPVQGTAVIVIHPGSSFLRIGRASDTFPHVVPQVIARRRRNPDTAGKHEDRTLLRHEACQAESRALHEQGLRGVQQALLSITTSSGQHRLAPPTEQLAAHNAQVTPHIEETSDLEWTDTSSKPEYLVGQEVLYLHPSECYNIHWPMSCGQLHLHSGPGGSLTAVLADLETIWTTAIENFLDIPIKDLKHYRCILLVPDIYNRQHIKELINLLLDRLGFSAAIAHQESVCATFGSGVASACVVDVGDQKTAVCCVEDGLSHRNSRYFLPFQDMFGARCQDVHVQRPDTFSRRYQVRLGEETIQCNPWTQSTQQQVAIAVAEKKAKSSGVAKAVAEKKAKASSKQDHGPDGDKTAPDSKPTSQGGGEATVCLPRGSEPAPLKLMGVDQAILHSIECCASDETKKKMFSCILVVGGGMKFPGAQNFLLHRVRSQLPAKYRNIADTMEVITRPKDQDPQMVCWKGAAVLACLDTTQELWVGQREWRKFGIRILRERSPFVW